MEDVNENVGFTNPGQITNCRPAIDNHAAELVCSK